MKEKKAVGPTPPADATTLHTPYPLSQTLCCDCHHYGQTLAGNYYLLKMHYGPEILFLHGGVLAIIQRKHENSTQTQTQF